MRIPVPKPVHDPNRCNPEPFKPETPKRAPYVVLARERLTLQVVYPSPAHFQLPEQPPEIPFRPIGRTPAGCASALVDDGDVLPGVPTNCRVWDCVDCGVRPAAAQRSDGATQECNTLVRLTIRLRAS